MMARYMLTKVTKVTKVPLIAKVTMTMIGMMMMMIGLMIAMIMVMMRIGMMMEELNLWQIWKVHTSHHGSTKFWIQNIISHYNPFYDFKTELSQY